MRWFIFIQKILIFDAVVSNDMRLEYFSGYKSMGKDRPQFGPTRCRWEPNLHEFAGSWGCITGKKPTTWIEDESFFTPLCPVGIHGTGTDFL